MALSEGFNFRDTLAFVTDPPDSQFVSGSMIYPTTAGGVTFGWSATASDRNRDAAVDPRLAGINFDGATDVRDFQVDLSTTGTYDVYVAMGDATNAQTGCYAELLDDTTIFQTLDHDGEVIPDGEFYDASDVLRTAAAWPGDNVPVQRVFGSTTFILRMGKAGNSGLNWAIAHVAIIEVSAPDGGVKMTGGLMALQGGMS